jgi:hypothetical protein
MLDKKKFEIPSCGRQANIEVRNKGIRISGYQVMDIRTSGHQV